MFALSHFLWIKLPKVFFRDYIYIQAVLSLALSYASFSDLDLVQGYRGVEKVKMLCVFSFSFSFFLYHEARLTKAKDTLPLHRTPGPNL